MCIALSLSLFCCVLGILIKARACTYSFASYLEKKHDTIDNKGVLAELPWELTATSTDGSY